MLVDRDGRRRAGRDRARFLVDRGIAALAGGPGRRGRDGGRGRARLADHADRQRRPRSCGPSGWSRSRSASPALVMWFTSLGFGLPSLPRIERRASAIDRTADRPARRCPNRSSASRARSRCPIIAPARSSPSATPRSRNPNRRAGPNRPASTCATITGCRRSTCSSRRRPSAGGPIDKAALERNARLLETVLDDFHVKGSIIEVRPGPVVTMYELEPAAGHQGEPRDPARRRHRAQHVGDLRACRDGARAHRDRHRIAQRQARNGQPARDWSRATRSRINPPRSR